MSSNLLKWFHFWGQISYAKKAHPDWRCVALSLRMVGESIWKILETHSNKTNSVLKVLKPDCTYQVKVQVQCLSRVYNTNDFITLRAPEGRKHICSHPSLADLG